MRYVEGTAGQEVRSRDRSGRERRRGFAHAANRRPRGRRWRRLPDFDRDGPAADQAAVSTITAINLDRGEIVWQIAHGDTPDAIRNNPALKGLNIPRTGQSGYNIGTLVTKTPGDRGRRQVTTTADASARRDAARL